METTIETIDIITLQPTRRMELVEAQFTCACDESRTVSSPRLPVHGDREFSHPFECPDCGRLYRIDLR